MRPTDAATRVMTDFEFTHPITVTEERCIDDALEDMISLGVRALLVAREGRVTGLITSYDIQGERPLQFLQSSTYRRHDEIRVGHIMTPWERMSVVRWEGIREARVADVCGVFRTTSATHLVVLQAAADDSPVIRGLISRTELERRLAKAAELTISRT
ncbi:MAG: CBS domain-containing protein [Steroidobacteraceae bacterium]